MRTRSSLCFAALAVLFVTLFSNEVVAQSDDIFDLIVPEAEKAPEKVEAPEEDALQEFLPDEFKDVDVSDLVALNVQKKKMAKFKGKRQGKVAAEHRSPVARAVMELKAYCIAAKKKIAKEDLKAMNNGASSSIVTLINEFGTMNHEDIVLEYSNIVGKLFADFDDDFWRYFVKRLNMFVLGGKSPIETRKTLDGNLLVVLDHRALGLKQTPKYLIKKLGVPLNEWAHINQAYPFISDANSFKKLMIAHAADAALDRIKAKWTFKNEVLEQSEKDYASLAIRASLKTQVKQNGLGVTDVFPPAPQAGIKGAQTVYQQEYVPPPTHKQMLKQAMKEGVKEITAIAARNKGNGNVIREITDRLAGISVRMATGPGTVDVSVQLPKIKVFGTLGMIDSYLDALPARNKNLTNNFPQDIGKPLEVRIYHDPSHGTDGWLNTGLWVQHGVGHKWVKYLPRTCGGKVYTEGVWLNGPNTHPGGSGNGGANTTTFDHDTGFKVSHDLPTAKWWLYLPEGDKDIACVHWQPTMTNKSCDQQCAFKGNTLYGTVPCKETFTARTVPDSKCTYWEYAKPARAKKICAAMPQCAKYVKVQSNAKCPAFCGFKGKRLYGTVKCRYTKTGKWAKQDICENQISPLLFKPQPASKWCKSHGTASQICVERRAKKAAIVAKYKREAASKKALESAAKSKLRSSAQAAKESTTKESKAKSDSIAEEKSLKSKEGAAKKAATEWTKCAWEGKFCPFSGTKKVRYGINGKYAFKTITSASGTSCSNSVFGDPNYGIKKECFLKEPQFKPCATEGGVCAFNGPARMIQYGAAGKYKYKKLPSPVKCTNRVFGDPIYGVTKKCNVGYDTSAPERSIKAEKATKKRSIAVETLAKEKGVKGQERYTKERAAKQARITAERNKKERLWKQPYWDVEYLRHSGAAGGCTAKPCSWWSSHHCKTSYVAPQGAHSVQIANSNSDAESNGALGAYESNYPVVFASVNAGGMKPILEGNATKIGPERLTGRKLLGRHLNSARRRTPVYDTNCYWGIHRGNWGARGCRYLCQRNGSPPGGWMPPAGYPAMGRL
jgi:hypothetical protein